MAKDIYTTKPVKMMGNYNVYGIASTVREYNKYLKLHPERSNCIYSFFYFIENENIVVRCELSPFYTFATKKLRLLQHHTGKITANKILEWLELDANYIFHNA